MAINVVILNDTRGHHHFGCYRVMRTIETMLRDRGAHITATSLVRNDWESNPQFLSALADSDLILINAEGTLHHGSRHADTLLRVVFHPARKNTPIAIVNALYQENPPEWQRYLDEVQLIATRDTASFVELEQHNAGKLYNTLDLSLALPVGTSLPDTREKLIIGDSVFLDFTKEMLSLSQQFPQSTFLPIVKTFKSSKPQYGPVAYAIREAYIFARREIEVFGKKNTQFCKDEFQYMEQLAQAYLHVTGRFHSVCFSMLAQTPFLAVESNSWKIEMVLKDVGLSPNRVVSMGDVSEMLADDHKSPFSPDEMHNLIESLEKNRHETDAVFDRIISLVKP